MDGGCKASQRLATAVTLVLQSLCLEQSRQICTGIKLLDVSVSCKSSDLSSTWPGLQQLIYPKSFLLFRRDVVKQLPLLFATHHNQETEHLDFCPLITEVISAETLQKQSLSLSGELQVRLSLRSSCPCQTLCSLFPRLRSIIQIGRYSRDSVSDVCWALLKNMFILLLNYICKHLRAIEKNGFLFY